MIGTDQGRIRLIIKAGNSAHDIILDHVVYAGDLKLNFVSAAVLMISVTNSQ